MSKLGESATVRLMAEINERRLASGLTLLAGLLLTVTAQAGVTPQAAAPAGQGAVGQASPVVKDAKDTKAAQPKPRATHYKPDRFAGRAGKFYELNWGVDSLSVKLVESGELVRFSYRVLDPDKARVLNDKQSEASLIDPKAGVRLVVPTMEKIGQLRQSSPPEAGRSYWMTFSNKGRHVARGDRVDVVIGTFKANFLVVD